MGDELGELPGRLRRALGAGIRSPGFLLMKRRNYRGF